jgi:AcrR family transcriptional regulator
MPSMIGKFLGKRTRQKDHYWRDRKVDRLYRTGTRLLADGDYEHMSVVRLTRNAKVSIGAFYGRFQHKDNFVGLLRHLHRGQPQRRRGWCSRFHKGVASPG